MGRALGLGFDGPFLHRLTETVIVGMKGAYPELERHRATIQHVTQAEEERFLDTLDKGLRLLDEVVADVKRAKQAVIPGEALFKLYDTYGFPLDLAADSARDQGLADFRKPSKSSGSARARAEGSKSPRPRPYIPTSAASSRRLNFSAIWNWTRTGRCRRS